MSAGEGREIPDEAVFDAVTEMLDAAEKAGAGSDDDVGRMVSAIGYAITTLAVKVDELKGHPAADVERAVRQSLTGLAPEFQRRWRWQRWAQVIGSAVVSVAAIAMVMFYLGHLFGAAASDRWVDWCGDPANVKKVGTPGSYYCLVPAPAPAESHH